MKQIINYGWNLNGFFNRGQNNGAGPYLTIKENGVFSKLSILNQSINFRLGEKFCIGFFRDSKYYECPENRKIEAGWRCDECVKNDDYFLCVKCDGSDCKNPKQRKDCEKNEYFIYLASFDSLLKVGISQKHRFLERLVEQGADFGTKIAYAKDGQAVRNVEQKIGRYLGIVDRVYGDTKHRMIFGDPNNSAAKILEAILKLKNANIPYITNPEIYDLREYYNLEYILSAPQKINIKDNVSVEGKVIAAKGNIIILEKDNDFFSVNAHSLIGRLIQ